VALTIRSTDLQELIEEVRVAGAYESGEAVVADAVANLRDLTIDEELAKRLMIGVQQLENGRWADLTEDLMTELHDRASERAANGESPAPHIRG